MTWESRHSCLKEQTWPTRSHQVRIGVRATDAAVLSSSPSVYVCSGRNTAPTLSSNYSQASVHLWNKHLWWVILTYNRCPHLCLNGHEQFTIEIFCQWSRVSTISRTTLWQRYDKERLSIHCRKASCKTKHFARYVPSVLLEGHSFLMSYWLSMSVLTIPTLMNFDFKAIEAYHFKCIWECLFP